MNILYIAIGCLCIISFSDADICNSRRRWGRTCKSCSERVLCINGGEEWQEISLGECGEGYRCDSSTGECIETKTPCYELADDADFICLMTGFFPDPFDCTAYHVCKNTVHQKTPDQTPNLAPVGTQSLGQSRAQHKDSSLVASKYQCPLNQYYSTKTKSCLQMNRASSCNQADCMNPGQISTWPDEGGFYYICTVLANKKLYPQMLRCPVGEQFDGRECAPVAPVAFYSGNDSNGLTESLPSTKCSSRGFSVNSSNCRRYIYCDGSLKAWEHECPVGQYFDMKWKLCMPGSC